MKEQDSFKELGLGMLSNGSEKDHRLFLEEEKPEKDNSRGDFYVVGNTISSDGSASVDKGQWEADGMPISLKRFNDGGVEVDFGKLPEGPEGKPLEKADTDNKPVKSESRWLKRARKVFTVATAAAAVSVPAIAEEVQDQVIEVDADEVREKINSVTTAEPSPAPTAEVTILDAKYDEDRYGDYVEKVKNYGCTDESMANDCGRFLYSIEKYYDNTDSLKRLGLEEKVLEYSISGVADRFDVYAEDGVRFMFAYNESEEKHNSGIIDAFSETISWLKENGCPNIVKYLSGNGVNLFYSNREEGVSGMSGAVLQDPGVIVLNMDSQSVSEANKISVFRSLLTILSTEPFGIAQSNVMSSVGGLEKYFDIVEINKSLLSSLDISYRYISTGKSNYDYSFLGADFILRVDNFLQDADMSLTDPYLIRQLYLLVNGGIDGSGLAKPMNLESWNDIFNTLVIEVLDWDGVDITDEEKFGEMIVALHDAIPGFLGQ